MNCEKSTIKTTLDSLRKFDTLLSNTEIHFKDVHSILQKLFHFLQKISADDFFNKLRQDECQEDILSSILKSLTVVISSVNCPLDTALLSGACFCRLILQVFGIERGLKFLCSFNLFGEAWNKSSYGITALKEEINYAQQKSESILKEEICAFGVNVKKQNCNHVSLKLQNEMKPTFMQFSILHGALCCLKTELTLSGVKFWIHRHKFLLKVFHIIYNYCVIHHDHKFYALQLLLSWIKLEDTALENSGFQNSLQKMTKGRKRISIYHTKILEGILQILEANWESSVPGVLDTVREIYRALLEIDLKGNLQFKNKRLLPILLKSSMQLGWELRGKYILLSAILSFMDYKEFLHNYPAVPPELLQNMNSKYISSVSSVVYITLVKSMKESSRNEPIEEWTAWWLKPVFKALLSDNRAVIQNIANHILPWTSKDFPEFYSVMQENCNFDACGNEAVPFLLLRIAKENGYLLQTEDILKIKNNLHHKNEDVRIDIFTLLCTSLKKTETLSSEFLDYIKDFLTMNMNVDNPEFHHRLITQTEGLLIRIRISTAHVFPLQSSEGADNSYMSQIKFVEWLTKTAFKNTFPGACYQRRRFCIQLIDLIFKVFLSDSLGLKKGKFSVKFNKVVKEAQRNGFWTFLNDGSILKVLPLFTDYTEEVRTSAAKLLEDYGNWLEISDSNTEDLLRASKLLVEALAMVNNPHSQYRDCGVLLCKIIFKKCVVHHNLAFDFDRGLFTISQHGLQCVLTFLQNFIKFAAEQLHEIQKDFLRGARLNPIHGVLSVLHSCLYINNSFLPVVYKLNPKRTYSFLENLIALCQDVVNHALSSMMGNMKTDSAPSFEDMSIALENMMPEENEDSSSLVEFQLLLSCCWNCIKESCTLLSRVGELILVTEMTDDSLSRNLIQQISDILFSVLLKSRHRGAIESCKTALTVFCQTLFQKKSRFLDVPTTLLNKALDVIFAPSSTSVTRRSAGFPLLIQAVVAAEPVHQNKKLLHLALERLISVISSPVQAMTNDKIDVPQAHAFHILRALFVSTKLSSDVTSWLDQILPLCVAGFSSTSWAICNGALQLFGVLLPRLCGQKRVRDDDSEHNLISPLDLFSRCPKLYPYLLYQLQKSTYLHMEGKLCPELIPLLTLLTKLHPDAGVSEKNWKLVTKFKPSLVCLLGSPLWKIRCMATSAIASFIETKYALDEVNVLLQLLSSHSFVSTNFIHGILLTVQKIISIRHNFFSCPDLRGKVISFLKESSFLMRHHTCAVIHTSYFEIMFELTAHMNEKNRLEIMMPFLENYNFCVAKPAYALWKKKYVSWYLELSAACLKNTKKIFCHLHSDQDIMESYFQFLKHSFMNRRTDWEFMELWDSDFVAELVLSDSHPIIQHRLLKLFAFSCYHFMVFEKGCSLQFKLNSEHFQELLLSFSKKQNSLYVSTSAFLVLSFCLKYNLQANPKCIPSNLEKWIVLFYESAHPKNSEILKLKIAESVAVVGPDMFHFFPFWMENDHDTAVRNVIMFFEGLLLLLEDETEEIRNKAVMFVAGIPHNYEVRELQCNAAIRVIYQLMEDLLLSDDYYLHYLFCCLQSYPSPTKIIQACSSFSKQSLFEQEIINVYAEPAVHVLSLARHLKVALEQLYQRNEQVWHETVTLHAMNVYYEMEEMKDIFCLMNDCVLTGMSSWDCACEPRVFLVLHKLHFLGNIMALQKPLLSTTSEMIFYLEQIQKIMKDIELYVPSFQNWICTLNDPDSVC